MNKDYLKKFLNYSIKDFDDFHRQAYPNANERTYKSFSQSLKRIETVYKNDLNKINLSFLDNPHDLWTKLDSSDYSHNTNITTFSNVLKLLKIVDYPLHEYNKFQTILTTHLRKNNIEREKEIQEKVGYLPDLSTLKKIVIENIKLIDDESDFEDVKYLILLALMILSVPLKLIQYSKMKIVFGNYELKNQNNNFLLEDLNGNYFIKSKDLSIKITDKYLIDLIKIWIDQFNSTGFLFLKNENSKTGMNNKDIRIALRTATQKYFDIDLSNQDIRQIYMKHLMALDPDFQQKLTLSHILGYKNTDILELHQ